MYDSVSFNKGFQVVGNSGINWANKHSPTYASWVIAAPSD